MHERKGEHMNITLSIPSAVVQEARVFAESQGMSLNAMIREYLSRVVSGDTHRREMARSFREVASAVRSRRQTDYILSPVPQ